MSVTAKALWYIETHLDADVSLDAVSESAGVSRFHLSRAFSLTTGLPLTVYARARRLTEAARILAGGAEILDVALGAGYGSHEAFTRAFRQHFGVTPEQHRAHPNKHLHQEPLRMNPTATIELPTPKVVERESFLIFGLGQRCQSTGDPGIPNLWNRFAPYIANTPGRIGSATYGVCMNSDEAGAYDYIAGIQVRSLPPEPREFRRVTIPAQRHAVFEHRGHVSTIAATFRAIWEHGLADHGLKPSDGPLFEEYGPSFNGQTGEGGFEIWIPIR